MQLLDRLYSLETTEPEDRNILRSYLPYRSKAERSKSGLFDYQFVAGKVLCAFLKKSPKKRFKFETFRANCSAAIANRLTNDRVLEHIETMYFGDNAILGVSPEFLLLHSHSKGNPSSIYLSSIFSSFFAGRPQTGPLETNVNFLERFFLDELRSNLEDERPESNEAPYLPFLAAAFTEDLDFLAKNSDYLLSQFNSFLELYNFLYCAQLALNIRQIRGGTPSSKELYFILDTEKASQERARVRSFGYTGLETSSGNLFPILSLLEHLNGLDSGSIRQPLWAFANAISDASAEEQQRVRKALQAFGARFIEEKFFERHREAMYAKLQHNDVLDVLNGLVECSVAQFDPEKCTPTKRNVFKAYKKSLDRHIGRHFIQSRGRAGRVLVMNQDFLMLLTNLAVGSEEQVRFQELLRRFERRGVYFDKQSQQTLISFFERVGNVERMSDSGDAVYVRSTI